MVSIAFLILSFSASVGLMLSKFESHIPKSGGQFKDDKNPTSLSSREMGFHIWSMAPLFKVDRYPLTRKESQKPVLLSNAKAELSGPVLRSLTIE